MVIPEIECVGNDNLYIRLSNVTSDLAILIDRVENNKIVVEIVDAKTRKLFSKFETLNPSDLIE